VKIEFYENQPNPFGTFRSYTMPLTSIFAIIDGMLVNIEARELSYLKPLAVSVVTAHFQHIGYSQTAEQIAAGVDFVLGVLVAEESFLEKAAEHALIK
jgi:hypothetical protein